MTLVLKKKTMKKVSHVKSKLRNILQFSLLDFILPGLSVRIRSASSVFFFSRTNKLVMVGLSCFCLQSAIAASY